jgi:SAM-dependent methyltransferase
MDKRMFISRKELREYLIRFRVYTRRYGLKLAFIKAYNKVKRIWWVKHEYLKNVAVFSNTEYGTLFFRCNICGSPCKAGISELKREKPSCPVCGSTVRQRAIIDVLSKELFGESIILTEFPTRHDIIGIGMSDWIGYAAILEKKLGYKNTYYHRKPNLNITSIDPLFEGTLDFIISTDVFEHVAPPVSVAFENARKLLKPNGVLIFSVPYTKDNQTNEHFPDLHKFKIIKSGDSYILRNITQHGDEQVFDNLIFHGDSDGAFGATLEMRFFSESSLMEEFAKAGFKNVKFYKEANFEYGIYWECDVSLPIALRIK